MIAQDVQMNSVFLHDISYQYSFSEFHFWTDIDYFSPQPLFSQLQNKCWRYLFFPEHIATAALYE